MEVSASYFSHECPLIRKVSGKSKKTVQKPFKSSAFLNQRGSEMQWTLKLSLDCKQLLEDIVLSSLDIS